MSRIFRDWLRVRRGTVICVVIVCAIVSYSEQGNSQDDDIMKVVNEFQNPDPMRRSDAFYRLIETGLGARLTYRDRLGRKTKWTHCEDSIRFVTTVSKTTG